MPILMVADVQGLPPEAARQVVESVVKPKITSAPGFINHASGPIDGGWRVTEAWHSRDDFERWFQESITPALPAGAEEAVQISVQDLEYVIES